MATILVALNCLDLNGQAWKAITSPFDGSCASLCCSGNGNILYAVTFDSSGGNLFQSTNGGMAWTNREGAMGSLVACSGDGTKIVVGAYAPWMSTNSGESFTKELIYGNTAIWSASGNLILAAGDGIYISTNSGTTWSMPLTNQALQCAAVSANGEAIFVASQTSVFVSTNRGISWSTANTSTNTGWTSITCTADGDNVMVSGYWGLEISRDGGRTWIQHRPNIPFSVNFLSLNSSYDGSLVVAENGVAYVSYDFGMSWVRDATPKTCDAISCSADGALVLASSGGDLVAQHIPPPLVITPSASQLTLSWPAPSSRYPLQQTSDLASTNWLTVTNAITVTNYRNTVTLPPPATGNAFYRLFGPN